MESLSGCRTGGVSLLERDLKTSLCPWLELPGCWGFTSAFSVLTMGGHRQPALLNATNLFPYCIFISLEKLPSGITKWIGLYMEAPAESLGHLR